MIFDTIVKGKPEIATDDGEIFTYHHQKYDEWQFAADGALPPGPPTFVVKRPTEREPREWSSRPSQHFSAFGAMRDLREAPLGPPIMYNTQERNDVIIAYLLDT